MIFFLVCSFCSSVFDVLPLVLNETHINENRNVVPQSRQQRFIFNAGDENSSAAEHKNPDENKKFQSSSIINEARSNMSSSIGPASSTPSPSSTRHHRSISLTSTQTYFKNIQQKQQPDSSPISQVKRTEQNDDKDGNKQSMKTSIIQHSSNVKHGGKKDTFATVRFVDDTSDRHETHIEKTYL